MRKVLMFIFAFALFVSPVLACQQPHDRKYYVHFTSIRPYPEEFCYTFNDFKCFKFQDRFYFIDGAEWMKTSSQYIYTRDYRGNNNSSVDYPDDTLGIKLESTNCDAFRYWLATGNPVDSKTSIPEYRPPSQTPLVKYVGKNLSTESVLSVIRPLLPTILVFLVAYLAFWKGYGMLLKVLGKA